MQHLLKSSRYSYIFHKCSAGTWHLTACFLVALIFCWSTYQAYRMIGVYRCSWNHYFDLTRDD